MPKVDKNFQKVAQGDLSWWIFPQDLKRLKKEITPSRFQVENSPDLHVLKETDTRLVLRGHLGDSKEPFIIKVFNRPRFLDKLKSLFRTPRSHKEWRIGLDLVERDIPTPPLIASGVSRKSGFLRKDYLISREITGAKPLSDWVAENLIQKSTPLSEKRVVIQSLAFFVRKIHDKGVYSSDLHQGNILVQTGKKQLPLFYLIDLHSIRIKRRLTGQERIKNLVQLNDFTISMPDRLRFLKFYFQDEGLNPTSVRKWSRKIGSASFAHWRHLWKKRKRKCLRASKGIEVLSIGPWRGMIRKGYFSEDFAQLLERVAFDFRKSGNKKIKEGSRTLVKEIVGINQKNPEDLILKYYKTPKFLSKMKAVFRTSRARGAWINAHNLLMRGIPTPTPVAFGEKKRWGIVQESFFITEKIPGTTGGDIFLKEFLERSRDPEKSSLKKYFLIRLARMVRWMHQTGICHGDLKASNILVTIHRKKPAVFLVDMDGVKIRNKVRVKEVAKDLGRLKAAFWGIISQSDHEFFLDVYRRGNRFFQHQEKKVLAKVRKLTRKKLQQKQNL